MFIKRILTLSVFVVLTACTNFIVGEGQGLLDDAVKNGATKHRIYVATTRAFSEDPKEFFSGVRSPDLSLAYVDVSVPPEGVHKPGKIELPTSGKTNPLKHFAVNKPVVFNSDTMFQQNINNALLSKLSDHQDILVFVHGYNVSFSDAVLRITQFVHDSDFKGVPVLFSWASSGKTVDYLYDINSALQSRDNLVRLGGILEQTNARGFDVLAHSMGNLVTIEAFRQIVKQGNGAANTRLRRVIMASPDIDVDLFEAQLADFKDLKKLFYVLVSADDKALAASTRIAGGISRVGTTDPNRLAELGLNVVDLSAIDDPGTINHSKFADSPEIVQLIGRSIQKGNTLSARSPQSLATNTTTDIIRGVAEIPVQIIGGASGAIITLGQQ